MTSRSVNRFNLLETECDGSYMPPSLRRKEEIKLEEKKDDMKVNDFPSLSKNTNSTNNNVWGNNIKLSVIKDELRVSPVLSNKDLSDDKSVCECYYGDCCKYMNRSIAKYHNKYGVNDYDKKLDRYYYIDSYYGHLSFSSPSKFNQLIEEMELNGEEPYFREEEDEVVME
jgi:hypothetical protein